MTNMKKTNSNNQKVDVEGKNDLRGENKIMFFKRSYATRACVCSEITHAQFFHFTAASGLETLHGNTSILLAEISEVLQQNPAYRASRLSHIKGY